MVSKVDSTLRMQVMASLAEDQEEVMVVVVVEIKVELDEVLREENYLKLVWFVTKITPPADVIPGGQPQLPSLICSLRHSIYQRGSAPIA